MLVYWSWTSELIDGGGWKPGFSLLEKGVLDELGASTGGWSEPCGTEAGTEPSVRNWVLLTIDKDV